MDLLILGGNSPHNKEWVREVEAQLKPLFERVIVHDYAHWAGAGPSIDFEHELRRVQHQVRELGDYVIFAKSVGTILALKGIAEQALRPEKCVFVGTALRFAERHGHELEGWLKAATNPVLYIQNDHDPAGTHHELEHYLRGHAGARTYKTVSLPGENHEYNDWETMRPLIADFL